MSDEFTYRKPEQSMTQKSRHFYVWVQEKSGTHFSVCAFGLDSTQSESNVQATGMPQGSLKSLKPNSKQNHTH